MKKCDIAIIGAGSAGLTAAKIAAQFGVSVTIFEKHRIGGDCLYTGCIPSKSLISIARDVAAARDLHIVGSGLAGKVDYAKVRKQVEERIITIRDQEDNRAHLEQLGIQVVQEKAVLTSSKTLKAGKETYQFKRAIIATGSAPRKIKLKGIDQRHIVTSDSIWTLENLPKHMVVVGGGPVGVELGQAFAMLGSNVTIVEKNDSVLHNLDDDVSDAVREGLEQSGVRVLTGAEITDVREETTLKLTIRSNESTETYLADHVLLAVGRIPNTSGLGLKSIDVDVKPNKGIVVDHALRTTQKSIYAAGDVIGGPFFTHWAGEQAGTALVHALFGKRWKVAWSALPWAIFTTPEIAHVGASMKDLDAKGAIYEEERLELSDVDKAVTDHDAGFIRVLLDKKRRVLGATIVGKNASELIGYYSYLMANNQKIDKLAKPMQPYPTYALGVRANTLDSLMQRYTHSNALKAVLKLRGY